MDLEQAIKTAIGYETRVLDVYRQSTGRVEDPAGKKVLEILAKEELEHLDYLKERLKEWTETGKVTPARLKSALPTKEQIQESQKRLESQAPVGDTSAGQEILSKALQMEKETSSFYREMVHQLDKQGQALFEPFVEIEEGHLTIVQAELDNLRGLGYWLDIQEFDMESG
jgi:rubrerythrin